MEQAVRNMPRWRRWAVSVCWRGNRLRLVQNLQDRGLAKVGTARHPWLPLRNQQAASTTHSHW